MEIRLHNTMSGKTEAFVPITPHHVSMYHCGPTVYNYAHIGNMRAYVFTDILRRTFEYNGYDVRQVMNITDIGHLIGDGDDGEDKMTSALLKSGKPLTLDALKEHADFFTKKFIEDLHALNIEIPQDMPKASENIDGDIALIKTLEEKGFVYKISDGVYFDTSKDADYGRLGNIKMGTDDDHSRIGINSEKKNHRDFCVWKLNEKVGWESPWGKGFPGWHLECSVMSMRFLGDTFDIHTGGIDHIPVHHNNEIAQSESASGLPLAHYWLHSSFVNINGAKIAKSEGNGIFIKDLSEKGIPPLAYRYWLLTAHYRTLVNFTEESVKAAGVALERLLETARDLSNKPENSQKHSGVVAISDALEDFKNADAHYQQKFDEAINDDLNTAEAIAVTWEMLKDPKVSDTAKLATLLDFDAVLGLSISQAIKDDPSKFEIPEDVQLLINEREKARLEKDWITADKLRDELAEKGYDIKDEANGPEISKRQ